MVDVFALRLTLSSYESLLPFSRSSETWQQRPDNSEQEKKKKSELSVGLMRVRRMLTLLATYDTPTTEIETTAHRFWPLRWSSWASWRRENEWRKLFLFCPVLQLAFASSNSVAFSCQSCCLMLAARATGTTYTVRYSIQQYLCSSPPPFLSGYHGREEGERSSRTERASN